MFFRLCSPVSAKLAEILPCTCRHFPRLGLLLAGDCEGAAEIGFRLRCLAHHDRSRCRGRPLNQLPRPKQLHFQIA